MLQATIQTRRHGDHANIINHWLHIPGKLLFRLECKGYPLPEYPPGLWNDRGRVVLDIDNNPVKKWKPYH